MLFPQLNVIGVCLSSRWVLGMFYLDKFSYQAASVLIPYSHHGYVLLSSCDLSKRTCETHHLQTLNNALRESLRERLSFEPFKIRPRHQASTLLIGCRC